MAKLSEIDECINQEKGLRMFNGGEKKGLSGWCGIQNDIMHGKE